MEKRKKVVTPVCSQCVVSACCNTSPSHMVVRPDFSIVLNISLSSPLAEDVILYGTAIVVTVK